MMMNDSSCATRQKRKPSKAAIKAHELYGSRDAINQLQFYLASLKFFHPRETLSHLCQGDRMIYVRWEVGAKNAVFTYFDSFVRQDDVSLFEGKQSRCPEKPLETVVLGFSLAENLSVLSALIYALEY